MDRRTLGFLIAGVTVLMVIVLWISLASGGLDRALRDRGQAAVMQFDQNQRRFDQARQSIIRALEAEPGLFKIQGQDVEWPRRLGEFKNHLTRLSGKRTTLQDLIQKNDEKRSMQVEQLIQTLAVDQTAVLTSVLKLEQQARACVDFKNQLGESVQEMASSYKTVRSMDLTDLTTLVHRAGINWPGKKADLDQQLTVLQNMIDQAESIWQSTGPARQIATDTRLLPDEALVSLFRAYQQLEGFRNALYTAEQEIPKLVDQLSWTWDKILVDMEQRREGNRQTYHQAFEVTKLEATAAEGQDPKRQTHRSWQAVSRSEYESMKENLGMVVQHKAVGMYDNEAQHMVQPPGYAYVASPDRGRNRYGYWRRESGGASFWVFYGQYALMRDLFWGPSYRRISTIDYHRYDSSRQSGRTYYGRSTTGGLLYGSRGSVTSRKYANSRYVKTGGGGFRGSQYDSRSRASGSKSYRSSWGSSRSRFGGGK